MRPRAALLTCLAGFLLLTCKGGFPPFVHILTQGRSTMTLTGSEATLVALASDPEGDSSAIRFDWGDGDISEWSGLAAPAETIAMSHAWSQPSDFVVKAQARDAQGRTSDWVTSTTVRVLDTALVKWVRPVRDIGLGCPAVGPDGTIYVVINGRLAAFEADGDSLWTTEDRNMDGTPVLGPDGTIYALNGWLDELRAFGPDGSLRWADSTDCEVVPAVGPDGTVYLVADSSLYARNPDGSRRWFFSDTNSVVKVSPVIGPDGTVYFACYPDFLHAVNPDGSLKWTTELGSRVRGAMAVGPDGTIYLPVDGYHLDAVDSSGTLKWTYDSDCSVRQTLVGPGGAVYSITDEHVHALSPDSGTALWSFPQEWEAGADLGVPAINADTLLYLGSEKGWIQVVNPDGTRNAYVPTREDGLHSPAAIGPDGTVYIAVEEVCLFALKGAAPLAPGCWPKAFCSPGNTGCAAR